MIKAIIFDMDGVLIDSPKYVWKSFNKILSQEGVHIDDRNVKKYLGRSLIDQLRLFKKDYGIKDYNLEEFSKKAGEIELELAKKELKPNKSLNRLIREIREGDMKIAVATSSLKWRAEKILNLLKIKKYLDVLITAEDVNNHKPSPDLFLKAAEKLNINPKDCVVIEDAVNGVEAAKRGGMKAIALLTKFHTKEEFKEADLIIKSLDELNKELINNL